MGTEWPRYLDTKSSHFKAHDADCLINSNLARERRPGWSIGLAAGCIVVNVVIDIASRTVCLKTPSPIQSILQISVFVPETTAFLGRDEKEYTARTDIFT